VYLIAKVTDNRYSYDKSQIIFKHKKAPNPEEEGLYDIIGDDLLSHN
jgi:hypothetical protein